MDLIIEILGIVVQGIFFMIGLLTGIWAWFRLWSFFDWLTSDFVRILKIKYKKWKRKHQRK